MIFFTAYEDMIKSKKKSLYLTKFFNIIKRENNVWTYKV